MLSWLQYEMVQRINAMCCRWIVGSVVGGFAMQSFKVLVALFAVYVAGINFGWVAHDETVMETSIAKRGAQKLNPCASYASLPTNTPEVDVSKAGINRLLSLYRFENPVT